jgi:hypothetical protein
MQLVPPQEPHSSDGQNEIVVSLDDSMMGSGLQYAYVFLILICHAAVNIITIYDSGSSYVLPNGTLRARLEARLAKPEPECIIC